MDFSGLARYEWLLFELVVLGWAGWQLWSLRRDRLRGRNTAAYGTQGDSGKDAETGRPATRGPAPPADDGLS
jgi:hypothetical protein